MVVGDVILWGSARPLMPGEKIKSNTNSSMLAIPGSAPGMWNADSPRQLGLRISNVEPQANARKCRLVFFGRVLLCHALSKLWTRHGDMRRLHQRVPYTRNDDDSWKFGGLCYGYGVSLHSMRLAVFCLIAIMLQPRTEIMTGHSMRRYIVHGLLTTGSILRSRSKMISTSFMGRTYSQTMVRQCRRYQPPRYSV